MSELSLLASTELWTARMELAPAAPRELVQKTITRFTAATHISVVGYVTQSPNALTLLRWPDNRPGHNTPRLADCEMALDGLAALLNGSGIQRGIVPAGTLHCLMGRGKNGYDPTDFTPLSDMERPDIAGYRVEPAHMVSARATDTGVRPYGELAGVITVPASPENEQAIKDVGVAGEQWHFAIAHGPSPEVPQGRTDFWQTPFAQPR